MHPLIEKLLLNIEKLLLKIQHGISNETIARLGTFDAKLSSAERKVWILKIRLSVSLELIRMYYLFLLLFASTALKAQHKADSINKLT